MVVDRIARPIGKKRIRRIEGGDGNHQRVHGSPCGPQEEDQGKQPCRSGSGGGGQRKHSEVRPPKGVHARSRCLRHPALLGRNSNFIAYFDWFQDVQGSLPELSGNHVSLFPAVLPYPEILQTDELEGADASLCWWAKCFMNVLVAWSNYMVLGCPRPGDGATEPRVTYRGLSDVRQFADRLLGEVTEFASWDLICGDFSCEGKRAIIESLLKDFPSTGACYSFVPFEAGGHSPSTALAVVAERLAIPEKAGQVDPLDWLPPDRAEVVKHLADVRLPEELWDEVPVACHRVPPDQEKHVARRLLETGMAVPIPESDLPRTNAGRLLVGGLFAVEKSDHQDRLIFDRRPENSTMRRLRWADLPSGTCFTRLLLKPSEYLRASGDDLRNFYYTLRLPDDWVPYNSLGRRVDPELLKEYGKDPSVPHRLCFKVLGMGDVNGCDIAQATHEAILEREGVFEAQCVLAYNKAVPDDALWQGAYLDDLLIALRIDVGAPIPLDGSFTPLPPSPNDRDVQKVAAAEVAYEKANLERALPKAFRYETEFKAWGAAVDGVRGIVGAPLGVRRQVWSLLYAIVTVGWASQEVLRKVIGYLAYIFQYRRELYCLQHRAYVFIANMPQGRWMFLPAWLLDELRSMALHLPFAHWKMRRILNESILATDATPTSGGSVRAECPDGLLRALWKQVEFRGAPVRLDRDVDLGFEAEQPLELSRVASVASECLHWAVTSSYSFRNTSHINLQEARALRREIIRLTSDFDRGGVVQICLNDSRVVVGAVAKGRSSAFRLNGVLRTQLPFLVFGDVALALIWVETLCNRADYPSRFLPLPAPYRPPRWLIRLGVAERFQVRGLEITTGKGAITWAHQRVGLEMEAPINIMKSTALYDGSIERVLDEGLVDWVWFAPGCFLPARAHRNRVQRRGLAVGLGFEAVGPDMVGTGAAHESLWVRILQLADQIRSTGGYFFVELPRGSPAWSLRETELFLRCECARKYIIDMCAYGDEPLTLPRAQKPTVVMTNAPWFARVPRRCSKDHPHAAALRGNQVSSRSGYPKNFVDSLARALKLWLDAPAASKCDPLA